MSRSEHVFEFEADVIAEAARREAEYHQGLAEHWTRRMEDALGVLRQSPPRPSPYPVRAGASSRGYGDRAAWDEMEIALRHARAHLAQVDCYRTEAEIYGLQGDRIYELSRSDVDHFQLGDQEPEA